MRNRAYFPGKPFALAAAVFAIVFMSACPQPTPPVPVVAPSEKVFVSFEGPWGFATDPKDANFVIAMAPKLKEHRDLYVRASYNQTLPAGVYDLSMPPRTVVPQGTVSPDIVQTKIDPGDVQRVLGDKGERYAIRLPKPEAYVPSARYNSTVGSSPPPTSSNGTTKPWASAVSLQYSVGSFNTFQLAGTPDSGAFPPLPLQVDTPHISFIIVPAHDDDPGDPCHTHDRRTFHELTKLLGVTLYVDFPDSPASCRDKDPQKPTPSKAALEAERLLARMVSAIDIDIENADVEEAGVSSAGWLNRLERGAVKEVAQGIRAAFIFFGMPSADCKSPNVSGNG